MNPQMRILDADAHVIEPPQIFGAALLEGVSPFDLPPTTPSIPCGDPAKIADQIEHRFDAPSYLRAMDTEGIAAAVLYPSLGLFVPFQPELDARASAAACRGYNEWIASYCAESPSRLAAAGVVPLADVGLAVEEARRAIDSGLVGVMVRPNLLYGRNLGDAAYDPLYALLAEAGVVLAVHEGLGLRGGATIGTDRFRSFALRHACSHAMEQMAAMASLMLEGSLERHPTLRVAFLESGTGWLPYWLSRLDAHWEWLRETESAGLSLRPSDYFRRQCVISSDPEDPLVSHAVAWVGSDHVMWASDFPHPDALYPNAVATFLEESEKGGPHGVALEDVLWNTPLRFYGLERRFADATPSAARSR